MTEDAGRPVVVDASVAVKWVLVESMSDRAERLYEDCIKARRPAIAPALLPNEVTNAIYRRLRRGGLGERDADAAVARFARLNVWLLAPSALPADAYAFAKQHQLDAIHDALYVVLAQRLGAELWTDDLTLINSVGTAAPWVRWIGDYRTTDLSTSP